MRPAWGLVAVLIVSMAIAQGGTPPPDSLATQGMTEFAARCAGCHGGLLEGGTHAPPLVGTGFVAEWTGKKARALYSRIISTMPQDNPGTLTEAQALAITLFVFASNEIDLGSQPIEHANDLNGRVIAAGGVSR